MKKIIACRPGCYDLPLPEAMAELKKLGIDNLELNIPDDGNYEKLAEQAGSLGMKITTLGVSIRLDEPADLVLLEQAMAGAARIGTPLIFMAASIHKISHEQGTRILREMAEKAFATGVVLSIETHVPFAHNGDAAARTIQAVNSRGLGINFDTANVYYYNPKGIDAPQELQKILPHVSSVHLKESRRGEPKVFDFPALGQGVVDFPKIFQLLDGHGFLGPYTLELEGALVDGLPTAERSDRVGECLDYLKGIGVSF